MDFYPGWSGPIEGFGHEGYYAGDGHYRYVSHQQHTWASRQENRIVQNSKSDHPVSPKTAAVSGHQCEQGVPRMELLLMDEDVARNK
jgi:hypothetical protein